MLTAAAPAFSQDSSLVPTNSMSELSFANAAASVSREDLQSWADAIVAELGDG